MLVHAAKNFIILVYSLYRCSSDKGVDCLKIQPISSGWDSVQGAGVFFTVTYLSKILQ